MSLPAITAELLDDASQAFGVPIGDVREYRGEHDQNFRITTAEGERFLFKISRGENPRTLDWHDMILSELEAQPLGFTVPRLLETADGRRRIEVPAGPEQVCVRAMTWVEGDLLRKVPSYSPGLLHSLGATSAELTTALSHVGPLTGLPRHHWLIEDAVPSVRKNLSGLAPGPEKHIIESILAFYREKCPDIRALPASTVHQDLHDQNVMVDPGTHSRVQGVIDFGDAFYTARAADVAIAGTYAMLRQERPIHCFMQVVEGYCSVTQLSRAEMSAVFPMALMRLAVNWTTWQARNTGSGDSDYGQGRSEHTWPLIQELVDLGLERVWDEVVSEIPAN